MNDRFNKNEHRYRRFRREGGTLWTPGPEEQARTVEEVLHFLAENHLVPGSASLIEFGCGEAFLAEHLLQRGYRYTGVDLSPSAIDYARHKYRDNPNAGFVLNDVTDLTTIPGYSFDAGLDIMFLHMLIEDEDRRRYLSEVRRVLRPGGCALFIQVIRPQDMIKDITGVFSLTGTPRPDDAPDSLPRVPARFNSEAGYSEELEQAGFTIERLSVKEQRCIIHLRNPKE